MGGNAAGGVWSGIGQAIGAIGNIFTHFYNNNQARKRQMLQYDQQRQLAEQQKRLQMELWEQTNYPAQVEQLKKAGLNPGLLYGMGGAGGATTGSVGQGQAQQAEYHPLDIGGIYDVILKKEQKKLIEENQDVARAEAEAKRADAELKRVTAASKAGIETEEARARILNLTQDVENKKAQQILTEAQTRLANMQTKIAETQSKLDNAALKDRLEEIAWNARKAYHENEIASNEAYILERTKDERIKQIRLASVSMVVEQLLKQSQTEVNKATIEKISNEIEQNWQQVFARWTELDYREKEVKIKDFEAFIRANYPNIWNAAGAGAIQLAEILGKIMTGGRWWEGAQGHRRPE